MTLFIDSAGLMGEFEDGKFVELSELSPDIKNGNIYRGRVKEILPKISAYFVDIGYKEDGYLSFKDTYPANAKLKKGQEILVQIKKTLPPPKGHRVTMEISIGGQNLVLFEKKLQKFSNKLKSDEVKRLKSYGIESCYGILCRTSSKNCTRATLKNEIEDLEKRLKTVLEEKNFLPVPKLIYEPNGVKDFLKRSGKSKVIINSKQIYDDYRLDFENLILDENFSIKTDRNLSKDYNNLFEPCVNLDCGGQIIIEKTAALWSIDVNSSYGDGTDFEKTALLSNLEAAKEGARQIILRNMSGIIIFDFINMQKDEDKELVIRKLKDELERDKSQNEVYGYTSLGLVEVSRKNFGLSLRRLEN